ncbi:MAG: hypothetical protein OQK12_18065 [Motiliproteus sp.]|nr:hypothetical protein [Motiliproteus sp.]MCW9051343.1 hypothetical protein [Motiliproteus sp.]
MPRFFLFLAAFALVGFAISSRFFSPAPTWEPFNESCLRGGSGTKEQCACLTDYIHDRLDQDEIDAIMENRVSGRAFQDKVANIVRLGTKSCR